MKKKSAFLLVFLSLLSTVLLAQKNKKKEEIPHYTTYFKPISKENSNLEVEITNALAKAEYAKFKMKLINRTSDYLVFKPQESKLIFANKDVTPEDTRIIIIDPSDKINKVIDAKGNGQNIQVDSCVFRLGGLYRVYAMPKGEEVPAFKLPATINEVTAGNFKIERIPNKKETREINVKFKVTYTGDGYALVNPKKLAVKTESGQEFANSKNQKEFLLTKGNSETLVALFHIPSETVDMKTANLEILWRDTFKECDYRKLIEIDFELMVDEGLTEGKNQ